MRKIPLIALGLFLLLFLIPISKAQVYYISECTEITSPGEYYLTQDILDWEGDICMNVYTNNIILDCQGHTISSASSYSSFMNLEYVSNITIRNCIISNFSFYFSNCNDLTFINNTFFEESEEMIYFRIFFDNNLIFINNTIKYSEFMFLGSTNAVFINNTIYGVGFQSSDYFTMENNTFEDLLSITHSHHFTLDGNNINYLIIYGIDESEYCHNISERNFMDGKPMLYFDGCYRESPSNIIITDTSNYSFWGFVGSSNITIKDSFASQILLGLVSNATITNMNLSKGIVASSTYSVVITNNSISGGAIYGINLQRTTFSEIANNVVVSPFRISESQSNVIYNNIILEGLLMTFQSNYNLIYNNIFRDFAFYICRFSSYNHIFNNLFNSTGEVFIYFHVCFNYWNTTRQPGERIYSYGTEIGGNYWTNSEGTGYSDICDDEDKDGFCDEPYVLNSNNIDYLPLSSKYFETEPPKYSLNSTNSTFAGSYVMHSLFWQDNFRLSHAVFYFDNCTGNLQPIATTALSGSSAWSNFTVKINDTPNCLIRWCVYANDTFGNWNTSSCEEPFTYFTTELPPPPPPPPPPPKPPQIQLLNAVLSIIAILGVFTYFITAFEPKDYKSFILYIIVGIFIILLLSVLLKSL